MLDVKDICCNYGNTRVLENINFKADAGECIGIIGPNGSGKSTLLKTLSKILKPASGKIILCDQELDRISRRELAKKLGVVPQDTSVDFEFTCMEVVLMGRNPHLRRFEIEGKKDYDIVHASMELTNTLHLKDRPISELSGGERQRIIIARALAQEPSVLLLDEPISHLDINHQIEILDLIEKLKKEKGIVVITVLHDLNLAARYCDRLILLHNSRILKAGNPEEVLTQEAIQEAFHAKVLVRRHPLTGYLYITLLDPADLQRPMLGKTIHIICGAGTGTQLMYTLLSNGYNLTTGVLNVLDSDYEAAVQLNIKAICEAPFSPITSESYAQNLDAMHRADAIVLSDVPFGWGNLKNLEALFEMDGKKPILLFEHEGANNRDFTQGKASMIIGKIKSNGAIVCHNIEEILASLAKLK